MLYNTIGEWVPEMPFFFKIITLCICQTFLFMAVTFGINIVLTSSGTYQ